MDPDAKFEGDRFLMPRRDEGGADALALRGWSVGGAAGASPLASSAASFVVETRRAREPAWSVSGASGSRADATRLAARLAAQGLGVRVREWDLDRVVGDVDHAACSSVAAERAAAEYRARTNRMAEYPVALPPGAFERVMRKLGPVPVGPSYEAEAENHFLKWSDALILETRGRLSSEEAHRACVDNENRMYGI